MLFGVWRRSLWFPLWRVLLWSLQSLLQKNHSRYVKFIYSKKGTKFDAISQLFCRLLVSGSCHLDRVSNDEFSVEFWIFVIVLFCNRSQVLKFEAPSRVPLVKRDNFEWIGLLSDLMSAEKKIKTNIQNSTLNMAFVALLIWHDPHISQTQIHWEISSNFWPSQNKRTLERRENNSARFKAKGFSWRQFFRFSR